MNNNIINIETGEFGLSEAQVKSWFIEREITVLWSSPFEPVAPFEFYAESEPPEHDRDMHKPVQIAPVDIEGVLTQQWEIVPLNADELALREADRLAAEQAARDAARVTISRTQGLIALFRLKGVEEDHIKAIIAAVEDPAQRYEAGVYFNASTWDSDNEFVLLMAPHVGAENEADLRALFEYARSL